MKNALRDTRRRTTTTLSFVLVCVAGAPLACDEHKYDALLEAAASASAAATPVPSLTASAPPPAPTWNKKSASDCKPHPTAVDFTDQPGLEKEVRRKLSKDTGPISPADLATIKSINLSTAKVHQIDPCIFPLMTQLKGCFLGAGEYDDLTPLQKLTTLQDLNLSLSQVKDLHAIEGLKGLDRLDVSHTLIGDDDLKSIGNLVNLTELTLDEDQITDLAPIAGLTKLTLLSIKKTGVKSLVPLAQMKALKKLYIADTGVSDITPVQPMMSLGMKLFQN
jgi:internalin A